MSKKLESDKRTIFGVTLSKRGWNNVVIYIVLILMFALFFIGQDRRMETGDNSFRPFAVYNIVSLKDQQHALIRVGNEWELREGQMSSAEQRNWLESWQELKLRPYSGLLEGEEYVVEIAVADQAGVLNIAVFFQGERTLVALPGYDTAFEATHDMHQNLKPGR